MRTSSRRAPAQVRQVVQTQPCGNFAQPVAAGCEEPAQQPTALELIEPGVPPVRAAAQTLENSCHLGRDHGLSQGEEFTFTIALGDLCDFTIGL